jgi:hypothetical protein
MAGFTHMAGWALHYQKKNIEEPAARSAMGLASIRL